MDYFDIMFIFDWRYGKFSPDLLEQKG